MQRNNVPVKNLINQFRSENPGAVSDHFIDVVEIIDITGQALTTQDDRLLMLISALQEGILNYEKELTKLSESILILEKKI